MRSHKTACRRSWLTVAALTAIYVGAYSVYRSSHTQVWAEDGQTYVLFGSLFTYYLFRPLSYLDGALTGMRFHIGPHR